MAFDTGNSSLVMPVAPTGGFGGVGFGGFDGDAWLILIIIFALFGGGFGGWGGGFNGGLGTDFPWLLNGQNAINSNTNAGFNQAATASQLTGIQSAIASGFGDTALGIAGINQNICQSGNATVSAVNGAQNAITQQMYGNTIADLERSYASQTATAQGFNNVTSQLAQCLKDKVKKVVDFFTFKNVDFTVGTLAA